MNNGNNTRTTRLYRHAAWLFAGLSIAANPAAAQSLATEFNAILNGANGVAARCRAALPNDPRCDDYNITPITDLQMRFAAPEELAAQKSLVKEFSAQQLKGVAGRLGALRMRTANTRSGARSDEQVALATGALGSGAAADPESGGVRAFSGYATLSHGFGTRDQTSYEDEADYKGNDLIVGADYRIIRSIVMGLAIGYSDKEVDLSANYSDATTPTTPNANGSTDASGIAATLYGQWESDSVYISASLGGQWLSYDLQRRADYVTGSPTVSLTANGETDSTGTQASLSAGYVLSLGASSIDTALSGQYQNTKIDEFRETGANCTTGACAGTDLNMRFAEQEVKSLETSLSVRVQHSFSTGFAVLIPFVSAEYIKQLEDQRYVITGMYSSLFGVIPNFNLNTDEPDTQYYAVAAGLSFVRQGGLQGFLRYRTTLALENVSDNLIAAGVRYEF